MIKNEAFLTIFVQVLAQKSAMDRLNDQAQKWPFFAKKCHGFELFKKVYTSRPKWPISVSSKCPNLSTFGQDFVLEPTDNPKIHFCSKSGYTNQMAEIKWLRFFLSPKSLRTDLAKKSKSKGRPEHFENHPDFRLAQRPAQGTAKTRSFLTHFWKWTFKKR